ncbi:MAG TPA: crosslink repair DNA glycosylase YcaQ family protein, partial [Streptosporangiaceae bacterium]|nr:crosslink repair DNA glycosylase YcaQ family protein [Streptosporangiaceae bacterium]
ALGLLTRRYLAGHAPAGDRDLAKWAGLPLGDARRGLAAIAPGLADREDGLASLAPRAGQAGPGEAPAVPDLRLLGAFDPLLLGWASRELFLAPGGPVITSNGLFRPFVLVQGRGAALWTITGGEVVTDSLGPLTAPEQAALAAEAADVERFLARPRGTPGTRAQDPRGAKAARGARGQPRPRP